MANFTQLEIFNALKRMQWDQLPGQKMTLTYAFGNNAIIQSYWESWLAGSKGIVDGSIVAISGDQAGVFHNVAKLWESLANIELIPDDSGHGDVVVIGAYIIDETIDALTIPGGAIHGDNSTGDIVLNTRGSAGINNSQLDPGQTGFNTLLHELGHALGLNHPIQNYPGDPVTSPLSSDPGQKYTVMSYEPVMGIPGFTKWYASKPMLYDILAIQTLYGVNPNTATGDNSYQFKTGVDAVQAIWDASK
jgi:Metallo-peptidase family M12B Reprolysin-like